MRRKKNKRLHEYLPSLEAGFSGKPGHKWTLYKRFKSFIHSPSKICVRKKGWFSHITKKGKKENMLSFCRDFLFSPEFICSIL